MKKRLLRHGPAVALGIGAGIAAAVLFSLAIRATFVAAVLANLSPLPIMIATLGYGALAGAAAVASATVTVAGIFNAQQKFGKSRHRRAWRSGFRFLPRFAGFLAKPSLGVEPGEGKSELGRNKPGGQLFCPRICSA